jgi:hypothetical protein
METERKGLTLSLKAADDGSREFSAVFATFDVVDHDGDITRPGAFANGAEVLIGAYGHNARTLPVGKGVIQTDQREARVTGAFFDTAAGREHYETLKAAGQLAEWSYIYAVKRQSFGQHEGRAVRYLEEIDVWSVDPVLKGAGIGTRTLAIKSATAALPFIEHSEEITGLVDEYLARVKERLAARAKEGRTLSAANVERLTAIAESLMASADALVQLLADATAAPKGASQSQELERELIRFERIRAELLGVH